MNHEETIWLTLQTRLQKGSKGVLKQKNGEKLRTRKKVLNCGTEEQRFRKGRLVKDKIEDSNSHMESGNGTDRMGQIIVMNKSTS